MIKMANVIHLNGDALKNDCDILCHQVNLHGSMGGGIAYTIARTFPEVEKIYEAYPNKTLGEVCFAKTNKYVIANCFSEEEGYITNYEALGKCLDKVVTYLKDNNLKSVAIPYKYGCGIADGDWNIVEGIFRNKLKGYTLKIYRLKIS